jgi:hypothetical protein
MKWALIPEDAGGTVKIPTSGREPLRNNPNRILTFPTYQLPW